MKLTNIRKRGRYLNNDTGKEYNVLVGRKIGYGVDVFFSMKRGTRIPISDRDLYHNHTKLV